MELINWLLANWQTVAGSLGAAVLGASMIVKVIAKMTKNTTDDKLYAWLVRIYDFLHKYVALNTEQPENIKAKLAALKVKNGINK